MVRVFPAGRARRLRAEQGVMGTGMSPTDVNGRVTSAERMSSTSTVPRCQPRLGSSNKHILKILVDNLQPVCIYRLFTELFLISGQPDLNLIRSRTATVIFYLF